MDGYAYILSYLSSIQPLLGYGSPKSIYSIQYLIINWIPKHLQQIHLVFWSYAEPCVSPYAHVRVQEPYATVMLGPLQWKPQSVTHRRLCHGPHGCILLAVSQSCPLWWRVIYNPFVECVSLCLEYVFLKAVYPFISPNVEQTLCMCTASLGTEHAPRGATDGSTTLRNLGVSLLCGDRPLLEQPWWQFPTMCWTCQHLGSTTYIYVSCWQICIIYNSLSFFWMIKLTNIYDVRSDGSNIWDYSFKHNIHLWCPHTCAQLRLFYAVKRNVKILIEQPQSSVPCLNISSF